MTPPESPHFGVHGSMGPVLPPARSGTFADNMKLPVHRWFRYSAGFSGEWAEQLIRGRSPSVVLDPFSGSGTTLLAAEAAGVLSFGFESHPFVARIATATAAEAAAKAAAAADISSRRRSSPM